MGQGQLSKLAEEYPGIAAMVKDQVGIPANDILAAIDDLGDLTTDIKPDTANVVAAIITSMNGGKEVVSGPMLYVTLTTTGWGKRSKVILTTLLKGSTKEAQSSSLSAIQGLVSTLQPVAEATIAQKKA
ncbi:unnamed protein product [Rotaria magnacalcarata]|uniref:Uncharacterized protein n=1 Tax=Rotaria magnacalcarata TaxID=392030 RepID=A0A815MJS8_9BILA|nr:unnamed protein product [Rotaria magnacalcarata]CAF3754299.1 unnamed protein product [Rotaria magnacalcarata]